MVGKSEPFAIPALNTPAPRDGCQARGQVVIKTTGHTRTSTTGTLGTSPA